MPYFIAALLGGLYRIAGTLAGQVLIGLGISVFTYTGVSTTIDWLKSSAVAALVSLPPEVVGILGLMKVGTCISMVFSAMAARMALDGLTSGTFKRWVHK
jgi:hypothetical protein